MLLLGLAAASPPIGYLADRTEASSAAGDRFRRLEPGHGRHRPGSIVSSTSSGARASWASEAQPSRLSRSRSSWTCFRARAVARALAAFFLAVPVGAALGLSVGAAFAHVHDWQTAFLAVGAPGMVLALVALVLPDPVRGSSEGVDIQRLRLHEQVGPSREDYIDLMVNSSYTYSVFGITFSSFAARRAGLLVANIPDGRPRG